MAASYDRKEMWASDEGGLFKAFLNKPIGVLHVGAGIDANEFLRWCHRNKKAAKRIEVSEYHPKLSSKDGAVYSKDGTELYFFPPLLAEYGNVTIPEGVRVIREKAMQFLPIDTLTLPSTLRMIECNDKAYGTFYGSGMNHLVFAEGVEGISDYAFLGAHISDVAFPKNLRRIGEHAFEDCRVEAVEFNNGLKEIGRDAFRNCKLKEIILPKSVKKIGKRAFALNPVESIKTDSRRAAGYLLADAAGEGYLGDKDHDCFRLEFKGKKYAVPAYLGPDIGELRKAKWQKIGLFGPIDAHFLKTAYMYPSLQEAAEDGAMLALKLDPEDKKTKEFIKRHAASMVERYMRMQDREKVMALAQAGFSTAKSRMWLLEKAGDGVEKAYVLEACREGEGEGMAEEEDVFEL